MPTGNPSRPGSRPARAAASGSVPPGRPGLTRASLAGAVDLSSLAAPAPRPDVSAGEASEDAGAASAWVIDVTEASFTADVVDRSRHVPVVLDFWAAWCAPCRQLSPILEKLAREGGGSWVLAKIDVDANQRLAGTAGVQSIPAVKAVIDGQIVAEFDGVVPEAQLRPWLASLVEAAGGRGAGGEDPASAELSASVDRSEDALRRGDFDAAEREFAELAADPQTAAIAAAGFAQVALLRRITAVPDPAAAIAAADAAPTDVEAQTLAADLEIASGRVREALARVIATVRLTSGEERDRAREHVVGLLAILPPDDPIVVAARRDLARALF